MYQQMVIDEAGAARTPVPLYAQEYRGKLVDFRIGNEPETLAVGEKLCAELAESVGKEASEAACVHVDGAHEKIEQSRWSRDSTIHIMDSRSGDDFWKCWSQ